MIIVKLNMLNVLCCCATNSFGPKNSAAVEFVTLLKRNVLLSEQWPAWDCDLFSNSYRWSFLCLPVQNDHSNALGFEFCPSTFLSQKYVSDWKPEMRLPNDSEYVVLNGLDWNTEYEVHVVAENQQGRSEPGIRSIRTASEPTTIPGTIPIHPPRASTHTRATELKRPPPWPEKGGIT